MKKYKVEYNHEVYKPNNLKLIKAQKLWSVYIKASSLEHAKRIFKLSYNLNPAYFKFTES